MNNFLVPCVYIAKKEKIKGTGWGLCDLCAFAVKKTQIKRVRCGSLRPLRLCDEKYTDKNGAVWVSATFAPLR